MRNEWRETCKTCGQSVSISDGLDCKTKGCKIKVRIARFLTKGNARINSGLCPKGCAKLIQIDPEIMECPVCRVRVLG